MFFTDIAVAGSMIISRSGKKSAGEIKPPATSAVLSIVKAEAGWARVSDYP